MHTYHFVAKSGNAKTGPIPVTTTSADTCPHACPLAGSGCYADSGPLAMHWRAVSNGTRGGSLQALCDSLRALPDRQIWRDNQAGDQAGDGHRLDRDALNAKREAAAHTRGFSYTHYPMLAGDARRGGADDAARVARHNRETIARHHARGGYAINLSANSVAHADRLAELAIAPVVVVLPASVDGRENCKIRTPGGRLVVVCPATYRDDVTCASCGICASRNPKRPIVGFPAHGNTKRRASTIAVEFA